MNESPDKRSPLTYTRVTPSPGGVTWVVPNSGTRIAWQSNGGAGRLHPARAFPLRLVVLPPQGISRISGLVLRGVFALYAAPRHEPMGAIGATLAIKGSDQKIIYTLNLVNGRHYGDSGDGVRVDRVNGDGTRLVTVGEIYVNDETHRLDELIIELPRPMGITSIEFRDMGTAASFALFDIGFDGLVGASCPFRGHGEQIALSEIGSIVRLRDWMRLEVATSQLRRGILSEGDLDEAKGSALTFLAVMSAAILDFGGERKLHRFQLDSARKLDTLTSVEDVAQMSMELCEELIGDFLPTRKSETAVAIDKALRIIEGRFAQDISDEVVAMEVGLSTSHFRHLFKERTGAPFHKYVLNLRLERARQEILASSSSIREIAYAAGFVSSAHFSRAFSQRFGLPPKQLRQNT